MFRNYYKIRIEGKDVKRFLKSLYKKGIRFINITILDKELICKVNQENYNKILNIKTSYHIEVSKIYGINHVIRIIKRNIIFYISFILGLLYLFFLSNIIFKINIIHDDKEIKKIIYDELYRLNIKKYSFIKSYDYIQKVKEEIINNNKNKIEWIEIEKIGTTYNIKFEKRIINKNIETNSNRHIVAKKSGVIKKIDASNGEIAKKVNDYVNKGEIIISGDIHKGEDVKEKVSATGEVYAEVWYKVRVKMPLYYHDEKYSKNTITTFKIIFLNDEYNLFNKNFVNKKSNNTILFSDFYNMISFNYSKDKELLIKDEVNTLINEKDAIIMAKDKILNILDTNEYIISQKKLKTTINDSTINVEVFFKVYENISSYRYY